MLTILGKTFEIGLSTAPARRDSMIPGTASRTSSCGLRRPGSAFIWRLGTLPAGALDQEREGGWPGYGREDIAQIALEFLMPNICRSIAQKRIVYGRAQPLRVARTSSRLVCTGDGAPR